MVLSSNASLRQSFRSFKVWSQRCVHFLVWHSSGIVVLLSMVFVDFHKLMNIFNFSWEIGSVGIWSCQLLPCSLVETLIALEGFPLVCGIRSHHCRNGAHCLKVSALITLMCVVVFSHGLMLAFHSIYFHCRCTCLGCCIIVFLKYSSAILRFLLLW